MQKFRNSGIEGGNGGLVRQIWLHKIQKYDLLCSKYTGDRPKAARATSKGVDPVSKILPTMPKHFLTYQTAALIGYGKAKSPVQYGRWGTQKKLIEAGFIIMVSGPTSYRANEKHMEPTALGATFQITEKGKHLLKQMFASPIAQQTL